MFPFKFEINEAISDYFKNYYKSVSKLSELKPAEILLSIYLMYIQKADEETINSNLKQLKLNYYITSINKERLEYIQNLPKTIYSKSVFTEEDCKFANNFGFNINTPIQYKQLLTHIVDFISNKYPDYKV
jgi:hypothetical protein